MWKALNKYVNWWNEWFKKKSEVSGKCSWPYGFRISSTGKMFTLKRNLRLQMGAVFRYLQGCHETEGWSLLFVYPEGWSNTERLQKERNPRFKKSEYLTNFCIQWRNVYNLEIFERKLVVHLVRGRKGNSRTSRAIKWPLKSLWALRFYGGMICWKDYLCLCHADCILRQMLNGVWLLP